MAALRKSTAVILSAVLLSLSIFTLFAYASTADLRYFERGVLTDGTNTAYYVIDKDNRTLYLTGDGVENARTPDYPNADSGPFSGRTDITCVTIEEDVAYVGDYVFANMKSVDTLEVQSNLISSSSDMSGKAMNGCTNLRHIRGKSSFLSTDILLEVVKGAINAASGSWIQLALSGINIVRDGISEDSLPNEVIHAMVNDYIMTGEEIFLGDLDAAVAECEAREQEPCYWANAYHHDFVYNGTVEPSCFSDGETMYSCSVCGVSHVEHFGIPLGHGYVYETLYESSCTKEGISKGICSRCGDIRFVSIPAKGHTEGQWKMTAVPSDSSGGMIVCRCSDCNELLHNVNVSITNTTYRKYKVGVNPSANTVSEIITPLEKPGYAVSAVKENRIMSENEKIGTGSVIYTSQAIKNTVNQIETVVLYGDVDGDGIIGDSDYSVLLDYIMGETQLLPEGSAFRRAADLNNDNTVDAFDLALLDLQISDSKALDQSKPQY